MKRRFDHHDVEVPPAAAELREERVDRRANQGDGLVEDFLGNQKRHGFTLPFLTQPVQTYGQGFTSKIMLDYSRKREVCKYYKIVTGLITLSSYFYQMIGELLVPH